MGVNDVDDDDTCSSLLGRRTLSAHPLHTKNVNEMSILTLALHEL